MTKRIYFYCCPAGSPENQAYQHAIVCLAEGLRLLKIPFYADRNYWRLSPARGDFLFNCDPDVRPDDCSIVVIDSEWVTSGRDLPPDLFHSSRKYKTAYLEIGDLIQSDQSQFRQFDFIFRSSYNRKLNYPSNVCPWAYGLSERMLQETLGFDDFDGRQNSILINFRHNRHTHSVRKYVAKYFAPKISRILGIDETTDDTTNPPTEAYHFMQWSQTGRRHYPQYYQRLKSAKAVAAFGGFFVPSWPQDQHNLLGRVTKKVLQQAGWKSDVILQWDSWRFWEALASGCVAFHVDLAKYGCALPVMPLNGQHYIGVDLDHIDDTINMIRSNPDCLAAIASEGKKWATENYTPQPTALRFLKAFENI